jgi:signal transduction histidine kinase
MITDITEKVALEANSLRTAHLAALGELAAGVAHEVNNPINGIINYARILGEDQSPGSSARDIADRIQKEGRRVSDIVKDLLLLARGGNKERVAVRVEEVLSHALDMIGAGLQKDGIALDVVVEPDLPDPTGDPQELQRVFTNILANAQHALNQKYPVPDKSKTLQIYAGKVIVDQFFHVRISFRDSGPGIPAHLVEKVKQPFFSTRPKGKGTGLGLSISEGIINEYGGSLTIESAEGEYTKIQIDLPTTERVSDPAMFAR